MIVTISGTTSWDDVNRLPLDVAVRHRNFPAAVILIEVGALDVTDFMDLYSKTLSPVPVTSKLDAFERFTHLNWIDLPHVNAQLMAAVMQRQISIAIDPSIKIETNSNQGRRRLSV